MLELETKVAELVDQIAVWDLLSRTKFPFSNSFNDEKEGCEIGCSLFATQTTVWIGSFLY